MSIDRNLWKQSLKQSYAPRWPCPSCVGGVLRLKRETLHFDHTAASRRRQSDDQPAEWEVEYAFSALLECNGCSEKISCCGIGGYEPNDTIGEDGNPITDYEVYFDPRYFSMPMELFRVSAKCPNAIKNQIRKSFLVFFCDLSAAANHLRQCVEEILSHADIQSRDANGGFIRLKTRIKLSFKQSI